LKFTAFPIEIKMETKNMKFIVICGATASGIGKGVAVSSIAALFKSAGYKISNIKIDPYLVISIIYLFDD
jgi:CTP synthase (UTP-ammonia lyase)